MKILQSCFILVLLLSFLSAGCSNKEETVQITVPQYPGATEDQEHDAKIMGMSLGKIKRLITDDSYEDVLAYYEEKLKDYNPEVVTYDLEDGRQTAMTIAESENFVITLAIQEFEEDGKVAIVYMRAGL
jgi:hypothetical protein